MAVSHIEEKILGRLASQTENTAPFLSASLYQVLGLSILLSRRLVKARRLRRLDTTRDTKSLELYYHIIWLAREGLGITEAQILSECQNGEQGAECRVMAAKLRSSFYHIFCLFHNHPPVSQLMAQSPESRAQPESILSAKNANAQPHQHPTPRRSPPRDKNDNNGKENEGEGGRSSNTRRPGTSSALRDPIPSMVSEASYITNPYAPNSNNAQSPPPSAATTQQNLTAPPLLSTETRRTTPTVPPGLIPPTLTPNQAAATFLLAPLNFVPMAREAFQTAQTLATDLLPPAHALRLSVALENCAFLWDCCADVRSARHLARSTIREVYASADGLDDEEFADAAALVRALGGIVRREDRGRGGVENLDEVGGLEGRQDDLERSTRPDTAAGIGGEAWSSPVPADRRVQQRNQQQRQSSNPQPRPATVARATTGSATSSTPPASLPLVIDRTIAISPTDHRNQPGPPLALSSMQGEIPIQFYEAQIPRNFPLISSPERLSTVPEISSASEGGDDASTGPGSAAGSASGEATGETTIDPGAGSGTGGGGSSFANEISSNRERETAGSTPTRSPRPPSTTQQRPQRIPVPTSNSRPSRETRSPPFSISSPFPSTRARSAASSTISDKQGKRRAVEQAEEIYRRTRGIRRVGSGSGSGSVGGSAVGSSIGGGGGGGGAAAAASTAGSVAGSLLAAGRSTTTGLLAGEGATMIPRATGRRKVGSSSSGYSGQGGEGIL